MNIEAAFLARNTRRAKIVLIGHTLPILDNAVRVADELAEIPTLSSGRLVSGFVRDTRVETWATTISLTYNRERIEAAYGLAHVTIRNPGHVDRQRLHQPRG